MKPPSTDAMAARLDELYMSYDTEKYAEHLDMVKCLGYKVYRNSDGKHKLVINKNVINEAFGGIFNNILKE